ncbi:MAG: DUF4340 domain-containing protein [Prevotella sp.]
MKKRNIVIISVTAVLVVLAVIVAVRLSRSSTLEQDFHVKDTSTVTKIFMADKMDGQVTLVRTADSAWLVDGNLPASQPMVDLLLETLNTMRIRQQVNRSAAPHVVKDIAAHSIKVEVYQREPLINWFGGRLQLFPREHLSVTYYVGRETPDKLGSHMYRKGDDVPYVIHIPGFRGFLTPRFVTDPLKWRSHTIVDLAVREIERVELEIPENENESFAIVRDGDGFAMEMLQSRQRINGFDTARVAQMLSSFSWLNFDEFAGIVPHSFADSCVSGTPRAILRITDTAGVTHELKTYIKYTNPDDLATITDPTMYETFDLDRLYAILDSKDTVLIQYYVFDNILQPASYFLGANKSAFAR